MFLWLAKPATQLRGEKHMAYAEKYSKQLYREKTTACSLQYCIYCIGLPINRLRIYSAQLKNRSHDVGKDFRFQQL